MTESSKNKIFAIGVIVFFALCLFFYFARGILMPFVLAGFLTYLLSPIVTKIQSYGFRRWVGVAVIVVLIMIILAAAFIVFIPIIIAEIDKLVKNFSDYSNIVNDYIVLGKNAIEQNVPIVKEHGVLDVALTKGQELLYSFVQKMPGYAASIISSFALIVLIPTLVFFMLLGSGKTLNSFVELIPSKSVETMLAVIYEIDFVFGRYIRGQFIEASFVGIMSVIALSALGINYAFLIGIIAGLANMIPYAGPFIGMLVASIVGYVQFQDFMILLQIVPAFLVIQFLDNNFVQPFAVGLNVQLGPVTMIFVMLAGAQIFGFLGIIFAVPVAAIFKTIFMMLVKKYKNASV